MKRFIKPFSALALACIALGSALSAAHAAPPAYTLTVLGPSDPDSTGLGVNDSGQVTGQANLDGNAARAFLSGPNGGPVQNLGTLPSGISSSGTGVNNSGQVVGYGDLANGKIHAFLSGPNGGPLKDLGLLPGGTINLCYGVNDSGQVTGNGDMTGGFSHAFLSGPNGGPLQDLGTMPGGTFSLGFGVNNSGQVVGHGDLANGLIRACLYSGGVMTDLNTLIPAGSGFTLYTATHISNNGFITGRGFTSDGRTHPYLLTPNPISVGPKITVTAATSAATGAGQRTVTVTMTNTGGASANTLQITAVTLGGAVPVPPSSVPTTPSTLLNTPGMNSQANSFVFTSTPGAKVAILHVVGRYTDPNNQLAGTFTATIRLPLP